MSPEALINFLKIQLRIGRITKENLIAAVPSVITAEQYTEITGEAYPQS